MAERRRSGGRSSSSGSRSSGSNTTKGAPSAAEITKLEPTEPPEEAKARQPSAVDAMGQDKRRPVVGHSYGPSGRSQMLFFVSVAVVLVVIVGGWLTLVSVFDQTPDKFPDRAPWSKPAASADLQAQQEATPKPVDTPCGEPGNQSPAPDGSPCASTESKPTASSGGK